VTVPTSTSPAATPSGWATVTVDEFEVAVCAPTAAGAPDAMAGKSASSATMAAAASKIGAFVNVRRECGLATCPP
jgi:hypothetical protein